MSLAHGPSSLVQTLGAGADGVDFEPIVAVAGLFGFLGMRITRFVGGERSRSLRSRLGFGLIVRSGSAVSEMPSRTSVQYSAWVSKSRTT